MYIRNGDYLMVVKGADGTSVAIQAYPANATDDYIIPVLASDGELVAVKMLPADDNNEYVVRASAADGETVAVTHENFLCQYARATFDITFANLGGDFAFANGTHTMYVDEPNSKTMALGRWFNTASVPNADDPYILLQFSWVAGLGDYYWWVQVGDKWTNPIGQYIMFVGTKGSATGPVTALGSYSIYACSGASCGASGAATCTVNLT